MEIEKVGDHTPIPVNVRIISATNKELETLIQNGLFREDFYFRINVFPIICPPLSSRKEDIPLLAERFIKQFTAKGEKRVAGLTPEAMEYLLSWSWPGNVRELRNVIEYALVLCSGEYIGKEHLPGFVTHPEQPKAFPHHAAHASSDEREALVQALRKSGGNQSEAARILEVSRVTVWKRIKKYGVIP